MLREEPAAAFYRPAQVAAAQHPPGSARALDEQRWALYATFTHLRQTIVTPEWLTTLPTLAIRPLAGSLAHSY